jgi:hypothetical protein
MVWAVSTLCRKFREKLAKETKHIDPDTHDVLDITPGVHFEPGNFAVVGLVDCKESTQCCVHTLVREVTTLVRCDDQGGMSGNVLSILVTRKSMLSRPFHFVFQMELQLLSMVQFLQGTMTIQF